MLDAERSPQDLEEARALALEILHRVPEVLPHHLAERFHELRARLSIVVVQARGIDGPAPRDLADRELLLEAQDHLVQQRADVNDRAVEVEREPELGQSSDRQR